MTRCEKGSREARLAITGARWKAASAVYCAMTMKGMQALSPLPLFQGTGQEQ
jgi:hypothetical protein